MLCFGTGDLIYKRAAAAGIEAGDTVGLSAERRVRVASDAWPYSALAAFALFGEPLVLRKCAGLLVATIALVLFAAS
jgi:hypothetical protein